MTVKYDSSGRLLWKRTYDSGSDDEAGGLAIDRDGNVYVAGGNRDPCYGYDCGDFITIKYDSSGNEVWKRTYDSGVSETATAVAIDAFGNVYVTGYTQKVAVDGNTYRSAETVKYNTGGDLLWARTFNVDGDGRGFDVAVDIEGNIVVTGDQGRVNCQECS